jgi:uncharacterized protein (TIRG00374 family)
LAREKNGGPKTAAKKILPQILRAALVAAPMAWIYAKTDAASLRRALASVDPRAVAAIVALLVAGMILQGVKWWTLIRRFVPELKLAKAVSVHLESSFYSIVLPANAQDIIKSAMLSKTHPAHVVWAASWLAKLIGLLSLLLFSAAGLALLENDPLPNGFRASLAAAAAAIAALAAISFSKKLTRPARAAAAKILPRKIMADIEKLRDGIYAFKHERKTLALTFLISAAVHLLVILTTSTVVYAASGKFYLAECLAFVPLVEIAVVSVPLTPGGVGIREALMALLFTRLGFSGGQIALYATLSLLGYLTKVVGAAPPIWRAVRHKNKNQNKT